MILRSLRPLSAASAAFSDLISAKDPSAEDLNVTTHAHAAFEAPDVEAIGLGKTRVPAMARLSDPRLFREFAFIDGRWRSAYSGATVAVTDPAAGEMIGHVPDLGAAETREAIAAAHAAFPRWR